jgi:hypothetical protein
MTDYQPPPYAYGDKIVVRTVTGGKIRYATCAYAVSDNGDQIAFFLPPSRAYSKVTKGTRVSPRRDRELALRKELLKGHWELIDNKPNPAPVLILSQPGQWFSINLKPIGVGGSYTPCYVNFQRPLSRTRVGFDSDDLCLDFRLNPSTKNWEMKDAADYQERIGLGMYSIEEQKSVEVARKYALSLIQAEEAPFDGSWSEWQPELDWKDFSFPPKWAKV